MSRSEINELKQEIYRHVDKRMFALAFVSLRVLLKELQQWWAISECDDLEMRCTQMLRYNLGDTVDVGRSAFIEHLQQDIYSFTDRTVDALFLAKFPGYDYEQMRVVAAGDRIDNEYIGALLVNDKEQTVYDDSVFNAFHLLFRSIWLSSKTSRDDEAFWSHLIADDNVLTSARQLAVSALMMRCLRCFDVAVLRVLVGSVTVSAPKVRARVIMSVVLLYSLYGSRLKVEKELVEALKNQLFDDSVIKDFELAYRYVIQTFNTDKVTQKIATDIYPEMMKSSAKINEMMKNGKIDFEAEDGVNPKWENLYEKTEFADKLREFADMQQKGDDVYMTTFSKMKGFDFFSEISNWFMPFDMRLKDVARQVEIGGNALRFLLANTPICNSDKYSFLFVLDRVPMSDMKSMMSHFGGDEETYREEISSEAWKQGDKKNLYGEELRFYSQDLFRFYRLHTRRNDFLNPFDSVIKLHDNKVLLQVLPFSMVKVACNSMFEAECWAESRMLFEYLDLQSVWEGSFYQQMGYCYQQLSLFDLAVDSYEKACLIEPGDLWTVRRKAFCYRRLGNVRAAQECYEAILRENTDDVTATLNLAGIYVEICEYSRARAAYFKADYLQPGRIKTLRGLAWCLFLEKDYVQSHDVYDKLLVLNDVEAVDWLNYGHLLMAMKCIQTARTAYEHCRELMGDDVRFAEMFMSDKEYLALSGITAEDMAVLVNQIIMLSDTDLH